MLSLLLLLSLQVTKLGRTGDNKFQVSYSTQGGDGGAATEHELLADTVMLATGGFAANKELLKVGWECLCVSTI